MRSQQERLEQLHIRAAELTEQKERRTLNALRVVSVFLFACLIGSVSVLSGLHNTSISDGYTGASLLDSSTGGYVLVAVVSFALAVVITIICVRRKNNRE